MISFINSTGKLDHNGQPSQLKSPAVQMTKSKIDFIATKGRRSTQLKRLSNLPPHQ